MSNTKRTIPPFILVNNQTISGNFSSNPFSIELYDRCALSMEFVGTLVGTVTILASNDYVPPNRNQQGIISPANWFVLPVNLVALSGNQKYFGDINTTGVPWIMINVAYTSGSSTLNAVVTAKES